MGIYHNAVKTSQEKGLASEWNDDHKVQGNLDFRHYTSENMRIENRTDFPAGPAAGRIIFRTDLSTAYIWNGTAWVIASLPEVKEFWVGVGGDNFNSGNYAVKPMANGGDGWFSFMIPQDFNQFVSVEILFIPSTTEAPGSVKVEADWAEIGEDAQTNTVNSGNVGINYAANEISTWDITTYLENPDVGSAIEYGDMVGVWFLNNEFNFLRTLGLKIRYT